MNVDLQHLGWTEDFNIAFGPYAAEGFVPGRIAVEHRGIYLAYTDAGDRWTEISGRLRRDAEGRGALPAVGDWVVLRPRPGDNWATIHAVLPRRSAFTRKVAGFETEEQVLAANVDFVWILAALTRGLSARRMERYLAVAWDSGAQPIIVLTKADLGEGEPERMAEVESVAVGARVLVTSAVTGVGLDDLRGLLGSNRTSALLGSSGVGKSTLINALVGSERLTTHETDALDVGRHTTTRRELVLVPSGGLVIDTPGLREIVMWEADTDAVFADISELASQCRFSDCSHATEPGCAVRTAVASGELDLDRLRSFEKMQRELAYVESRKRGVANVKQRRGKAIAKAMRQRRRLGIDQKS